MLGHAVREVTVSRGNKEGDNAFLLPEEIELIIDEDEIVTFAVKHNVSFEFLVKILKYHDKVSAELLVHVYALFKIYLFSY